jgi:hypothetical protein
MFLMLSYPGSETVKVARKRGGENEKAEKMQIRIERKRSRGDTKQAERLKGKEEILREE